MGEESECGCCCDHDEPASTEENKCSSEEVCAPSGECVPKEEEKEGSTTCIDPETADELACKLECLAKKAAECCEK